MLDSDFFTNFYDNEHMFIVQNAINVWNKLMNDDAKKIIDSAVPENHEVVWKGAVFGKPAPEKMFSIEKMGLMLINEFYIVSFTTTNPSENDGWQLLLLSSTNIDLLNNGITVLNSDNSPQYNLEIDGTELTPEDLYNFLLEIINHRNKLIEIKKNNIRLKRPLKDTPPEFSLEKIPYIISSNTIPNGFTFEKPIMFSYTEGRGVANVFNPSKGYRIGYQACINGIKKDIDNYEYDAVFNLKILSNSVEGDYDVIVYGDAVKISE